MTSKKSVQVCHGLAHFGFRDCVGCYRRDELQRAHVRDALFHVRLERRSTTAPRPPRDRRSCARMKTTRRPLALPPPRLPSTPDFRLSFGPW